MKKSKVIVPAMALLLFSTAASITGTVAWFTSTRTFTTSVGNFSVVEAEGNLACEMAAGIGTTYDSETKTVSVQQESADPAARQVIMTHGSICTKSGDNYGKAFVVNPDTGNTYFDRGKEKGTGDGWLYRENLAMINKTNATKNVDVYIAVSWKMTFTYSFAGESKPVAVYLDTHDSVFQGVDMAGDDYDFTRNDVNKNDADKGFRIGFYNAVYAAGDANAGSAVDNAHDLVWGNNVPVTGTAADAIVAWDKDHTGGYTSGDKVIKDNVIYAATATVAEGAAWDAAKWKVSGDITLNAGKGCDASFVQSDSATDKYTASNYVYYNETYNRVASDTEPSTFTAGTHDPRRVCVLNAAHPSVTITCAAWFEGTDPNVISGNNLTCLSAKMTFYSRSLTA